MILTQLLIAIVTNRCYLLRQHQSRYGGWSAPCCEGLLSRPISADISHAIPPSAVTLCLIGSPTYDTVC